MIFEHRHIGITQESEKSILSKLTIDSIDSLCNKTIPKHIEYSLPEFNHMSEQEYEHHIKNIAKKNTITRSFIGQGYHSNYCPSIIRRNILENPSWYTQYTPYVTHHTLYTRIIITTFSRTKLLFVDR